TGLRLDQALDQAGVGADESGHEGGQSGTEDERRPTEEERAAPTRDRLRDHAEDQRHEQHEKQRPEILREQVGPGLTVAGREGPRGQGELIEQPGPERLPRVRVVPVDPLGEGLVAKYEHKYSSGDDAGAGDSSGAGHNRHGTITAPTRDINRIADLL